MKNKNYLLLVLMIAALLLGALPAHVFGQTANSASLVGKVTDAKGAPLPGVSIVVTGPQLQVPQLTSTSDENGDYKVLNLPAPGVYKIAVTLQGFETFVRSDINLGVGFAGRVDIPMKIGEITQTVEVTGGSPVIDTTSAGTTAQLSQEALAEAPMGATMQEMLPATKGVSLQGPPDVGDSNLAQRSAVITYGVVLVPSLNYEGINMNTDKAANTAVYLDSYAIQEAEFKAVGNNADVAYAGIDQEAVMKSGSNTYHGHVRGDYENPTFQGRNQPSAASTSPLIGTGYYDYAADLGGRIIRDKLWGFGGYSFQGVNEGLPNFVGAPGVIGTGGCTYVNYWLSTLCSGTKQANQNVTLKEWDYKVSYQMKPRIKIIFAHAHGLKYLSENGGSASTSLAASQYQSQPTHLYHAELQIPFSPKFLLDAGFGHDGYRAIYDPQPASNIGSFGFTKGSEYVGSPSEEELSSKSFTGSYYFIQNRPQYRYEAKIFASFIPSSPHLGGNHQFKFGTVEDWENAGTAVLREKKNGDYLLLYNSAAGTTLCANSSNPSGTNNNPNGCPYEIIVYNYPFPNSTNAIRSYSGYITDQYTVKRLTLSFGVRGETYNNFYPTQAKTTGQFSTLYPAVTYPGQNLLRWTDVVPRVGGAYDLRGNGKTVIKGSFGMFGDTMGDLYANTFNPNAQQSTTFRWGAYAVAAGAPSSATNCISTDSAAPVQYHCDVDPNYLNYLNQPSTAFPSGMVISQTGGTTQILNPGLKQDKTYEFAGSIERQIVPNVSVSGSFVQHRIYNRYNAQTNSGPVIDSPTFRGNGIAVGHPLASYNQAITYLDTPPNGGTPTLKTGYTYIACGKPGADPNCSTNNEILNNPSNRPDVFNSFEVALTKKYSKRWTGDASFWETKDHRWINGLAGIAGSPDDNNFPLDETWNWEARGDINYHLPWGFQAYTTFRAQSGTPGQRYDAVTSGTNGTFAQGATNIAQEAYGAVKGPVVSVWNIKGAKTFTFKERWHVEANAQVYNVLNSSAGVTITRLTGSTYGAISDIVAPRVFRIGGIFSF